MSLVLYNTLTGRKETFIPIEKGRVKMYVCGPTVYDDSHIGHARSVVVFDVLYRYLKFLGYEVIYVRNFTDLDDKIIVRAKEQGIGFLELAERYIQSYSEDMAALGALKPEAEPRATEHIDQMIADIQALIASDHAYQVDGDVYFDITRFPDYGRLSGRQLEDMRAGARVDVDERKKNPWDFALWKESKPGEPAWESPWGQGRPGWHIECSVMTHEYLGLTFDIHGGGHDLIFPHHENEIAQAGALGRPFARYWLHNGFVRVNHEKMSKSLKNFFTVKEVLAVYHPEVLRYFLLSKHYRGPVDFSDEALREAGRSLDRVYRALQEAGDIGNVQAASGRETEKIRLLFKEAMDDDLNTARALGHVFEAVRELNRLLETQREAESGVILEWASAIVEMGNVLGILTREPADYFQSQTALRLARTGLLPDQIEEMVRARSEARARKDWAEADRLRDALKARGILLEDAGGQTSWRIES